MDPNTLSVQQLKHILKQYQLPLTGRKAKLILRMQQADPSDAWMQEAAQYVPGEANLEDGGHEGGTAQERLSDQDALSEEKEDRLRRRESELTAKEYSLMRKEIELLRQENDLLKMSPRSPSSTVSRTTLSIRNVCDLLCEYNGGGDDFERWKAQVNLLRDMYDLDENAAKVLVGSKLRGKAADWYYSLVDHLSMSVDRLLERMNAMFDQPMSRLERRRLFENRVWIKGEPSTIIVTTK